MGPFEQLEPQDFHGFSQLEFKPHPRGTGVQAVHKLLNGLVISVVGGPGCYGDGESSFEMAAFQTDGQFLPLTEDDDVMGWLSKEEVEQVIESVKKRKK